MRGKPEFKGMVSINGYHYYKKQITDAEGKRRVVYGKTRLELEQKIDLLKLDAYATRSPEKNPTVEEYCRKWLQMQSGNIRFTTMVDYTSKIERHIISTLGEKLMREVTLDDLKMMLVPVSEKSASVFKSVRILTKAIFDSAEESRVIDRNPAKYLDTKAGGKEMKERAVLTDEQAERLLKATEGHLSHLFIMLGLDTGLRREEILALQWDCVFLNEKNPYLHVGRAWHTEHNRPVIMTELKTRSSERDVPLTDRLIKLLKKTKAKSKSVLVISNSEGGPLSYTQYKRLWHHIVVQTAFPRPARKMVGGKYVKYTIYPELGKPARNNGKVVYCLDFKVTPHQLRHTYITNLIHVGVDPKTVQYLAGHKNSKITMDVYAKVKYNRPEELADILDDVFAEWDREDR